MAAVRKAVLSMEDGEMIVSCLQALGKRHLNWSVCREHFEASIKFSIIGPLLLYFVVIWGVHLIS